MKIKNKIRFFLHFFLYVTITLTFSVTQVAARDLAEIKKTGVLRHIGGPYANFVSYYSQGDTLQANGLDVELIRGFAHYLGVKYQFVPEKYTNLIGVFIGQNVKFDGKGIIYTDKVAIKGDLLASGVTKLAWRKELIDFSDDYFPSGVWLITRADSDLQPIQPSGSLTQDITQVKSLLKDRNVLAMKQTCLDPDLYNLQETGANIILPSKGLKLNEMVPAILNEDAENTLLDVSDALIALQKWPGEIKVIGPISEKQAMGVGFRKDSPELRKAFNAYLKQIRADGRYKQMVEKYYPAVFNYYGEFFQQL